MKESSQKQSRKVQSPKGLQPKPALVAGVPAQKAKVGRPRAAAGQSSLAAAEKPHQVSADMLPEVWKGLGLRPEDHAHLPPDLANELLWISVKFIDREWTALLKACRAHGIEHLLPGIYADFFERRDWVLDPDAESLALFTDMHYFTAAGQQTGHVELVRVGGAQGRIGMRPIKRIQVVSAWVVIDP
jgi:hypothetical protein